MFCRASDILLSPVIIIPECLYFKKITHLPYNPINANRSIAAALKEAGADVVYEEGEGIHDWVFWDTYIQHVLKWLDIHMDDKAKELRAPDPSDKSADR